MKKLEMKNENPWERLGSTKIYENKWISVREDRVLNPSQNPGIYGVVEFKQEAVAILPIDFELNTWIVGQYRYPHDTYEWEIPEGGSPPGEDTLLTAQRELLEEVGLKANHFRNILEMQLSNSTTNEVSVSYVATGIEVGVAQPDEDEAICIRKLPFSDLVQMVKDGEIRDALSVATILKTDQLMRSGDLKINAD